VNKKKEYASFFSKVKNCTQCALRENCTQVVPGDGNPEAKVMFIGEGPGKNEDTQGLPFVGAAGKFLDEMLSSIQLSRDQVYIANVVKCRPPQNRDPLPEEIATCRPWLTDQIRIIDPQLIVTLGRYSMNSFLPHLKISEAHGNTYRTTISKLAIQKVFLTLYHPAAALYNGGMRETLLKDFQKIPKLLEKINSIK